MSGRRVSLPPTKVSLMSPSDLIIVAVLAGFLFGSTFFVVWAAAASVATSKSAATRSSAWNESPTACGQPCPNATPPSGASPTARPKANAAPPTFSPAFCGARCNGMMMARRVDARARTMNVPPIEPTIFCRNCGYTLDGLASAACPECGRVFDPDDPATYRTAEFVRWYWAAVVCGVAPLVVGTSIFLLWLVFEWEWLMGAGMLTIVGGTALVLAGGIFLASHVWQGRNAGCVRSGPVIAVAALLMINFPAALCFTLTAASLYSR